AGCVAAALAPGLVADGLSRAVGVAAAVAGPADDPVTGPVILRPAGMPSTMSPLLITVALVVATVVLLGVLRAAAARRARRRARLWDCGAGPATARMEYTATSFAEPLVRVFDNVLAPETDLAVTPVKESEYLLDSVRYRTEVADRVEHRLYRPVLAFAGWVARAARPLANGSVHRYVGYGFYAFTGVLIILAVTRCARPESSARPSRWRWSPRARRCWWECCGRSGPGWRDAPERASASRGGTCAS